MISLIEQTAVQSYSHSTGTHLKSIGIKKKRKQKKKHALLVATVTTAKTNLNFNVYKAFRMSSPFWVTECMHLQQKINHIPEDKPHTPIETLALGFLMVCPSSKIILFHWTSNSVWCDAFLFGLALPLSSYDEADNIKILNLLGKVEMAHRLSIHKFEPSTGAKPHGWQVFV